MFRLRYLIASIFVGVVWGIGTALTGGYYDVITWSCWMISNLAVVFMFTNYLILCEKVYNGTSTVFDMSIIQAYLNR